MQQRMLSDQYARFSGLLKEHFGRNPYYERRKGLHPLPPEEQALVLQALNAAGVTEKMDFDGYKDCIVW